MNKLISTAVSLLIWVIAILKLSSGMLIRIKLYLLKCYHSIKKQTTITGGMNEDSMPIPIISEIFMAPGFRRFRSMLDLPAQTAMEQKGLVVVLIVCLLYTSPSPR